MRSRIETAKEFKKFRLAFIKKEIHPKYKLRICNSSVLNVLGRLLDHLETGLSPPETVPLPSPSP